MSTPARCPAFARTHVGDLGATYCFELASMPNPEAPAGWRELEFELRLAPGNFAGSTAINCHFGTAQFQP